MKKNKLFSDLEAQYNEQANRRKDKIRQEPNKFKRFWKWVWYYLTFPFVWVFYNIRDWRSAVCFAISVFLWSSSVWIWYALAIFTGVTTDTAKWFAGIGTSVWMWWISPLGSPFILLCTFTAIGMKMLWNKIKEHKNKKKEKKELAENSEK